MSYFIWKNWHKKIINDARCRKVIVQFFSQLGQDHHTTWSGQSPFGDFSFRHRHSLLMTMVVTENDRPLELKRRSRRKKLNGRKCQPPSSSCPGGGIARSDRKFAGLEEGKDAKQLRGQFSCRLIVEEWRASRNEKFEKDFFFAHPESGKRKKIEIKNLWDCLRDPWDNGVSWRGGRYYGGIMDSSQQRWISPIPFCCAQRQALTERSFACGKLIRILCNCGSVFSSCSFHMMVIWAVLNHSMTGLMVFLIITGVERGDEIDIPEEECFQLLSTVVPKNPICLEFIQCL